MTTFRLLRSGLLAFLLPLAACDEGGIRGLSSGDGDDSPRAEYSRAMIFVADDGTAAAVLEFGTVDAGSELRRSARGWAEAGSGWTTLYDVSWEGAPVRRAWRLVPHGPIRLRVGLEDEIEAVMVRDEDGVIASLEPGGFVAEWAPFRTAQLVLFEGTLALGGEPMAGWLLDARFGATPRAADVEEQPAGVGPNGVVPAAGPPRPDPSVSADSGLDAPQNAQPEAGAAPLHAVRAVLFGEAGEALVLGETDAGVSGWLWTMEGEMVLQSVALSPSPDERGWTLQSAGTAGLSGTLDVLDEQPMPLSPQMVRGTIRVDGRSLELHGVLLPAPSAG